MAGDSQTLVADNTIPLRALLVDANRLRVQFGAFPLLDSAGNLLSVEPECDSLTATFDSQGNEEYSFNLSDTRVWIGYTLPTPAYGSSGGSSAAGPLAFAFGLYCPQCSCQ